MVELLIALAIVTVVCFFSIPFTDSIYKRNQLQLLANEIENAILYAKTEALVRGRPLALTPLPATKDWSQGMLLFVDNKMHQYINGAELIHEWHWWRSDTQVTWHGFQSQHYLLFASDIAHSAMSGHFLIKDRSRQHKLIINRLGRVKPSSN